MCSAATAPPGKVVSTKDDSPTAAGGEPVASASPPRNPLQAVSSWAWQQFEQLAAALASLWAIGWLLQALRSRRPVAYAKEVWSLDELGLTCQIGAGRTGRVFQGSIHGQRVALKVCSPASLAVGDEVNGSSCMCRFIDQAFVTRQDMNVWQLH